MVVVMVSAQGLCRRRGLGVGAGYRKVGVGGEVAAVGYWGTIAVFGPGRRFVGPVLILYCCFGVSIAKEESHANRKGDSADARG